MKTIQQRHIAELARRGSLSHAWLLIGPAGVTMEETAVFLASAMLCSEGESVKNAANTLTGNKEIPCGACAHCRKVSKKIHPDMIRILRLPEKKELLVDQIREMAKEAYVLPNEARRKVFIIDEADLLNINAQNAMLKLLEEPPDYASFILLSENPGKLYNTVRSRCIELNIPVENEKKQYSELAVEMVDALLSGDGVQLVKTCVKAEKADKDSFDKMIEDMFAVCVLKAKEEEVPDRRERCIELSSLADRLREMRSYNVGAGHCLGMIMSKL